MKAIRHTALCGAALLLFTFSLPARAGTYYDELTTPMTVTGAYKVALNGSIANGGSFFSALVRVKHPSQAKIAPLLRINGTTVQLGEIAKGADGGRQWFYTAQLTTGATGQLQLKSTDASTISIVPSSTQEVDLQMNSCSTIPTLSGC